MTAKRPITGAHYETLAEFRYALRKFLRFSEEAARAAGVSPQQHQAMLAIKGFPGGKRITIGELAERLQIKPHSAVGLADRLAAEHYVRRIADPLDQRQVHLTLTSRGEAVLESLSAAHQEQLRRLGPQINRLFESLRLEGNDSSRRQADPARSLNCGRDSHGP
jgi:DNA-binding MarR family transcriptional regulator